MTEHWSIADESSLDADMTIGRLLSNRIVRLSDPFSYGRYWAYVFATDTDCERRIFATKDEAAGHLAITKSALALGSPFIDVQQLSPQRIREFHECLDTWYSCGLGE
jgi:hypothetical protein